MNSLGARLSIEVLRGTNQECDVVCGTNAIKVMRTRPDGSLIGASQGYVTVCNGVYTLCSYCDYPYGDRAGV